MDNVDLILWVAAIVCWLIAAFWRSPAWPGLVPLGLALAGLTFVI